MATAFTGTVTFLRQSRALHAVGWLGSLSLVACVGTLAYAIATGTLGARGGNDFVSMFMSAFIPTVLALIGRRVGLFATRTPAEIAVDARGVCDAKGEVLAERAAIHDGYLVPPSYVGGYRVRLQGKRGKQLRGIEEIEVRDASEGEAILRALDLDVLHKVFEAKGTVKVDGRSRSTRILVGADGVVFTRGAGFVAYEDIATVAQGSQDAVLELRSGKKLYFATSGRTPSSAVVERIKEGRDARLAAEAPADASVLVARRGKGVREWLDALRALARSGEDYRQAAVPEDVLWAVAENPAAGASARAGAAIVLRQRVGEAARVRLAAAATATAEPHVRVALEATATGDDDDALTEALEACDEGDSERRTAAGD